MLKKFSFDKKVNCYFDGEYISNGQFVCLATAINCKFPIDTMTAAFINKEPFEYRHGHFSKGCTSPLRKCFEEKHGESLRQSGLFGRIEGEYFNIMLTKDDKLIAINQKYFDLFDGMTMSAHSPKHPVFAGDNVACIMPIYLGEPGKLGPE